VLDSLYWIVYKHFSQTKRTVFLAYNPWDHGESISKYDLINGKEERNGW